MDEYDEIMSRLLRDIDVMHTNMRQMAVDEKYKESIQVLSFAFCILAMIAWKHSNGISRLFSKENVHVHGLDLLVVAYLNCIPLFFR